MQGRRWQGWAAVLPGWPLPCPAHGQACNVSALLLASLSVSCCDRPSIASTPSCAACHDADGQTGTGKTHTMTGDIAEDLTPGAGVIPRAIHQIFSHLEGEHGRGVCAMCLYARVVTARGKACTINGLVGKRKVCTGGSGLYCQLLP